ncbi:DNA polymerase eta-like [Amphiura filiformis]|uniref:DNA polymerase eta-like n=1 Tax=Amphiura filiformis TaxID=82378 RepID=UPI003B2248E6
MDRVIALVDMDCFYVQVEQRRNPELKGKPCAVVQYNQWKGGGIIAVSYEARAHGVTRQMRGDEAKRKCPLIQLVSVPVNREKADLTRYREAGAEVINVLTQFSKRVERASIDEAYIDLTEEVKERLQKMKADGVKVTLDKLPYTFVVGWEGEEKSGDDQDSSSTTDQQQTTLSEEDSRKIGTGRWLETFAAADDDCAELQLSIGAIIAEEMRAAVLKQTGFNCSAGISGNKSLAKLSCGLHKPRKQTILPQVSIPILFQTMPLHKVRNLGGKLGASLMEGLKVKTMGELCQFTEKELQAYCGDKTGAWLYGYCRGVDDEPVRPRELPKSVGCSKNFTGKAALDTKDKVKFWLHQLSEEITERLKKEKDNNNRIAKSLSLYIRQDTTPTTSLSRSCGMYRINAEQIAGDAFKVIQGLNAAGNHQAAWSPAIICIGISASKFIDSANQTSSLDSFLTSKPTRKHQIATTVSKPDENEAQTQNNKTEKSGVVKRKSLDFFFSPSQTVTMSQSSGQNNRTTQKCDDDADAEKNVRRNSLEHFFSQSQRTPNKPDTSSNQVQMSQSDQAKTTGQTDRTKVEVAKINLSKNSKSGGRGFFAAKLQEKSSRINASKTSNTLSGIGKTAEESSSESNTSDNEVVVEADESDDYVQEVESVSDVDIHAPSTSTSDLPPVDQAPSTSTSDLPPVDQASESLKPTSDEVMCDKCNKPISVWEYPEHLDYHFALELQKQSQIACVDVSKKTGPSAGSTTEKVSGKRREASGIKFIKESESGINIHFTFFF